MHRRLGQHPDTAGAVDRGEKPPQEGRQMIAMADEGDSPTKGGLLGCPVQPGRSRAGDALGRFYEPKIKAGPEPNQVTLTDDKILYMGR